MGPSLPMVFRRRRHRSVAGATGGHASGLGGAFRTATPVDDFGLIDLVALVANGRQTGGGTDSAVDIGHPAADTADDVMVIVADSGLETSGRPGGLDTPDEAPGGQDAEGVVHRLMRDGAYLSSNDFGRAFGRDVGLTRNRPQHSHPLGRDLDAVLAKKVSWVNCHGSRLVQTLDSVKGLGGERAGAGLRGPVGCCGPSRAPRLASSWRAKRTLEAAGGGGDGRCSSPRDARLRESCRRPPAYRNTRPATAGSPSFGAGVRPRIRASTLYTLTFSNGSTTTPSRTAGPAATKSARIDVTRGS